MASADGVTGGEPSTAVELGRTQRERSLMNHLQTAFRERILALR